MIEKFSVLTLLSILPALVGGKVPIVVYELVPIGIAIHAVCDHDTKAHILIRHFPIPTMCICKLFYLLALEHHNSVTASIYHVLSNKQVFFMSLQMKD